VVRELVYNDELTAFQWALNSAVECHLHTVEVIGSNPIAPTINISFPHSHLRVNIVSLAVEIPARSQLAAARMLSMFRADFGSRLLAFSLNERPQR
jgi:hypothetical protein